MTGVSQEILKNLVLAGVHASLCDARPYPDAVQTTASFFLLERNDKKLKYDSVAHAMKDSVEELNPLLGECEIVDKAIGELDDSLLAGYDMVIASHMGMKDASRIAAATTKAGGKFYLVDCFGWNGACVLDLGKDFQYRAEVGKGKLSDLQTIATHVALEDIWKIPQQNLTSRTDKKHPPMVWLEYRAALEYQATTGEWPSAEVKDKFAVAVSAWMEQEGYKDVIPDEILHQWARVAAADVSPVCAVLGGVMGNEVIKAISNKGEPANNCILFDGKTGKCRNVLLKIKE